MAPTPNKDSTCWDDVAVPEEINFLYDGVDKSMLHQAVRESKAIVGRIMDKIYPGGSGAAPEDISALLTGQPV